MTFLLDGATHNDPFNNLNLPLPFPDALQEFKVETSGLSAQYGSALRWHGQCGNEVGHQRFSWQLV